MNITEALEHKRQQAVEQVEKTFGKGSIFTLTSKERVKVEVIPTGIYTLDRALGVGGLARGKIHEIYGPESTGKTSLCLSTIAELQQSGGLALFVDAEHALNPDTAIRLGVNINDLLIAQPDNGEEALEIVKSMVGQVDLIVVDSVAALVPRSELEGKMGDAQMGLHARLMGQAMRKLTGSISKTNTTVIFINQIRHKIGVMFGCFNYNSRVLLADGKSEKIGKIVNQKKSIEVLSYNFETQKVEPKKIIDWHHNGKADFFYQFTVEKAGGNGVSQMACTPNHSIFTPDGLKNAEDLKIGDEVLTLGRNRLNNIQRQVAYGSLLGDGSLQRRSNSSLTTRLRFGHGAKQTDYCKWKSTLFGDLMAYNGFNSRGGWCFDVTPTSDLTFLYTQLYTVDEYSVKKRQITLDFLNMLTPMSIAIWYMDDASFSGSYTKWGHGKIEISVKSYSQEDAQLLRNVFAKFLGEDNLPTLTASNYLLFSGKKTHALQKLVAPYIHPSMDYKLHPSFRGLFREALFESQTECPNNVIVSKILNKSVKPITRSMEKFDITVEDNSNYFVDGILVHNSPETTTGGNALKFFASTRLDVRRSEIKKGDGSGATESEMKIRVVKNKMAPPFQEAFVDISFSPFRFNKLENLIKAGAESGFLEKAGTHYSYGPHKLGQGLTNAANNLAGNADLLREIKTKMYEVFSQDNEVTTEPDVGQAETT